jgi:hypothetical protein
MVYHASINIDRLICDFKVEIQARGLAEKITDVEAADVTNAVEMLIVYCERLGLVRTKDAIDDILMPVKLFPPNAPARSDAGLA